LCRAPPLGMATLERLRPATGPASNRVHSHRAILVTLLANNKFSVDKQKQADLLAKGPNVPINCFGVYRHWTGLQLPKPAFGQIGQKQLHWSLPCRLGEGRSTTIICSVADSLANNLMYTSAVLELQSQCCGWPKLTVGQILRKQSRFDLPCWMGKGRSIYYLPCA
jgi:hypothetical protein